MSPPTVIADDDEGGLWSVPYTLKGDTVSWGDPVEVRVQYVEKDSGKVAASSSTSQSCPAASAPGGSAAAESRPTDRVRAATTDEGGTHASRTDCCPRASRPARGRDRGADARGPPEPDAAAGTVTVDQATFAQMQDDARAGREARNEQIKARREKTVDDAIHAGKFPPARRDHYLTLMEKDEAGTTDFITKLAVGAIPVAETGKAPAANGAAAELDWFPQFKTPAAAGKEG
jgi:hypothetical protein